MEYADYLTPEQAQKLAEMGDPQDQIDALGGMQGMANRMGMKQLPQYGNGRVIGANSPLEALGGAAQQVAGAYMNAQLANKYGDILKQGNANRGNAAGLIVNALRKAKGGDTDLPYNYDSTAPAGAKFNPATGEYDY